MTWPPSWSAWSRRTIGPSIACPTARAFRAGVKLSAGSEGPADLASLRQAVSRLSRRLGTPLRLVVGKPGLDGHSNGAEQIAQRAAQCGIEVRYDGIRFTPQEIVKSARDSGAHMVGLSVLSGSHVPLVREVMNGLRSLGLGHIPVVVGGIIPEGDGDILKQLGVARVYSPKDFKLNRMIGDMVEIVEQRISDDLA